MRFLCLFGGRSDVEGWVEVLEVCELFHGRSLISVEI